MAVLSISSVDSSSITSPQKGVCHQRSRSTSLTDRNGFSRRGLRSSPMPLEDMLPGLSGEFMDNSGSPDFTPSPTPMAALKTPISREIYSSSKMMPSVACFHKLPLREFHEDPIPSRSNSSTPMPSFRVRSNSVSSLGGSSGDNTTRPSSQARTGGYSLPDPDFSASTDSTRPLSRHEVRERKQDAVDWFRASHAINHHSRPLEETEAILAAARERRARGAVVRRCPKVEKVEDIDVERVNAEDVAPKPVEEAPPTRRRLDPMLLWGAKKPAPKEKPKAALRRSHSIAGEGVSVGDTSFLARLRKRASTIE